MCHSAAVAYNSIQHEYLVVWDDQWAYDPAEISAQRVSSTGQLISGFKVATGIGGDDKTRSYPAVAYNATAGEYLVVYVYTVTDEADYDIRGRRVAWDGSYMGPEIEIFNLANRSYFHPSVAWNSNLNQYLVVATAQDATTGFANDVSGRRVMADGSTPYISHNISKQSQMLQPKNPDVTYNSATDEYLVVWRQRFTDSNWNIWGARVRGVDDAVVNPPAQFSIDTAAVDQDDPAVATNSQDRYQVVWTQGVGQPATDWDIYGRRLDNSGAAVFPSSSIADSTDAETLPDVAINGASNQYMVAWRRKIGTGYAVWEFTWNPSLMTIYSPFEIAPTSPVWVVPAVAGGYPGFLTVYEKREDTSFIYGRMYWKHNLYLPQVSKN